MLKRSAGIVLYRKQRELIEILLVHPGGPFFAKKDIGAWSIPKGEFEETEEPLAAARREFQEETGQKIDGEFKALDPVKLKSGKIVHAFAVQGDIDTTAISSNQFKLEWPPRSGKKQSFPEVDKAEWFSLETAREKINAGQVAFLDQLISLLSV